MALAGSAVSGAPRTGRAGAAVPGAAARWTGVPPVGPFRVGAGLSVGPFRVDAGLSVGPFRVDAGLSVGPFRVDAGLSAGPGAGRSAAAPLADGRR
ncbi:hypothetical protein ACWGLI_40920, partial [Kitasatospora sp. NPDC054769]